MNKYCITAVCPPQTFYYQYQCEMSMCNSFLVSGCLFSCVKYLGFILCLVSPKQQTWNSFKVCRSPLMRDQWRVGRFCHLPQHSKFEDPRHSHAIPFMYTVMGNSGNGVIVPVD